MKTFQHTISMHMKYILILAITIFSFSSCQKVIKVDLNTANPQYVIEANLYEGTHDFKVQITKTVSYFDGGTPPGVSTATVTLTDNIHPSQTLTSNGDGLYIIPNYTATNNTTYQLTVTDNGNTFVASSYLPVSPIVDSLTYEKFNGGFGGPKDLVLPKLHFKDSLGISNFYRVIVIRNDTLLNEPFDMILYDDKLRDGEYIHAPVFSAFSQKGDSLDVQLFSMDEKVFDYFTTLSDILTGDANNSAAPANPNSNWSNNALGYFGAFSSQKKSVRIK